MTYAQSPGTSGSNGAYRNPNGELYQTVEPDPNPLRWLWWLLGLLALSLLMWALTRRCAPVEVEAVPTPPPVATPPVVAPPVTPSPETTPEYTAAPEPVEPEPVEPEPTEPDDAEDWASYPIIVNGVGIPDAFITVGDEIFPTHTPLLPVAVALAPLSGSVGVNPTTGDFTLTGHNGLITATAGSNQVTLESGQVIELPGNVEFIDDEVFVPIAFWRDAYGVGEATFHGGHVIINDAPGDR